MENNYLHEDCRIRHMKQDETDKKTNEIYEALIGTPASDEKSLKDKINIMFDSYVLVKNLIIASFVSTIIFIFTLGIMFERFSSLVTDVNNLKSRVLQLELNKLPH